ncbi:MAG: hypothetical protein WBA44_05110 [Mesorhizobium sp.]
MHWHERSYARPDAARMIGISLNHLDVIIHQNRDLVDLFSGKVGSRRLFSIQDIATLKVAHSLERFGLPWLQAIAEAFNRLERPPPEDLLLVLTVGRSLPVVRRTISDRDVPRLPVEQSTLLVPIGRIAASISGAANVAIQT